MVRVLTCCLTMVIITGCNPLVDLAAVPATIGVLGATKKLPSDHMLSSMTGRDCSVIHFEKTGDYCPPYPQEIDRSKITCIKTLGDVECHQQPDRYAHGEHSLASPPPMPKL